MQIMGDCSNLLVTKAIKKRFLVEQNSKWPAFV